MSELLRYNIIKVKVSRKKILKALEQRYIDSNQIDEFMRIKRELEVAINRIRHIESIVERILLKTT